MVSLPGAAAGLAFSPTDIKANIEQLEAVNYNLLQRAMRPGMRGNFGHLVDHARRIFQDRQIRTRRVEEGVEPGLHGARVGRPLRGVAGLLQRRAELRQRVVAMRVSATAQMTIPMISTPRTRSASQGHVFWNQWYSPSLTISSPGARRREM